LTIVSITFILAPPMDCKLTKCTFIGLFLLSPPGRLWMQTSFREVMVRVVRSSKIAYYSAVFITYELAAPIPPHKVTVAPKPLQSK